MKPISRLRNPRALAEAEVRDRLAVEPIVAIGRGIEQSENRQQRRLAAARRPGNRDVLSFLDLEVNLLERVRFHFIREENLLHAFHLNECAVCVRHDLSFASVRVPETRFHHPGPQIIRLTRTACSTTIPGPAARKLTADAVNTS